MDNLQHADFRAYVAHGLFVVFFVFYVVQSTIAGRRAFRKVPLYRTDGAKHQVRLVNALRVLDGGWHNVWTFFMLVIFVPVFFSSLLDVVQLATDEDLFFITKEPVESEPASVPGTEVSGQGSDPLTQLALGADGDASQTPVGEQQSKGWQATIYFFCISAIVVLITLEFSYIHNLRRSATEWISVLQVALAVDIATLLTLAFLVGHPQEWTAVSSITAAFMVTTTSAALLSSFTILLLARTEGALTDAGHNPHVGEIEALVRREAEAEDKAD